LLRAVAKYRAGPSRLLAIYAVGGRAAFAKG